MIRYEYTYRLPSTYASPHGVWTLWFPPWDDGSLLWVPPIPTLCSELVPVCIPTVQCNSVHCMDTYCISTQLLHLTL